MMSEQHKPFEPLGWFTKTAPIAAIFFAPFKSASPHHPQVSYNSQYIDNFYQSRFIIISLPFYQIKYIAVLCGGIAGLSMTIASLRAIELDKNRDNSDFLKSWAIAAASWGGTSFYNLDLSNVDFTNSELANTDFRARKLYRTCLKDVRGLDRARIDNQYLDLSNPQVDWRKSIRSLKRIQ
ncbi:MAG: hypothetical protein KME31_36355 [Tolypothrix carrinoi HA7290-LM1]|nr:hypothetical protein [Tolypothrix carrinoi HA7290-LM1]